MSLRLDTNVVLWWLTDDPTLAAEIKDRLDRMLVAQAQVERLTLMTRDAEIRKYDVETLAV
jgi:PIN domain nuclease of toxin-antitoxin system